MALQDKAMLASVSISMWSARKLDKKVTGQVQEEHRAKSGSGVYTKRLVPEEFTKPIAQIVRAARQWHEDHSLPWRNRGPRLITTDIYWEYMAVVLGDMRSAFEREVQKLLDAYPQIHAQAQQYLGDLFNPDDYPPLHQLRRRFAFDVEIEPFPLADDFRVQLNASEVERLQAEIEERTNARVTDAVASLWQRVADVTGKVVERLAAYDERDEVSDGNTGTFRDSLIGNVHELVSVLGPLNLTGDPHLEEVRVRLKNEVARYEAQTLRNSQEARNEVSRAAADILAKMQGYTGMAVAAE